MFKKLQDEAGLSRLCEVDNTVPRIRKNLSDSPVSMFIVQVRGSVGDCVLPKLKFNSSGQKLSFEWREMFDRFFGEQKLAKAVLHDTLVGHPDSRHFSSYLI